MLSSCGSARWPATLLALCTLRLLGGCASPGAPRPPSLQLPELVRDLAATRSGDEVQLRFTVPTRTTDGQLLKDPVLQGTLCRQSTPSALCDPVKSPQTAGPLPVPDGAGHNSVVVWTDPLPASLTAGSPRPLAYRLELRNGAGRSAGFTDPVYTAAGAAPPRIEQLTSSGSRLGVLLRWTPSPGTAEVLLERQRLDPGATPKAPPASRPSAPEARARRVPARVRPAHTVKEAATDTVWLQVDPGNSAAFQTLDGSAEEGVRYRYTGVRRITAKVGGRTLELRSAPSTPVEIAWHDIYPPPSPQQLTALGYLTSPNGAGQPASANASAYAVDLIWQPVDDPRLTGYLVDRQMLAPGGEPEGIAQRLTAEPVTTPAFHDTTALAAHAYRYQVVGVDAKGHVSAPATAIVPSTTH